MEQQLPSAEVFVYPGVVHAFMNEDPAPFKSFEDRKEKLETSRINYVEKAFQTTGSDRFSMFDDWMQRYEYMIELGKSLPLIAEQYKTDDNLIKGCQSKVGAVIAVRASSALLAPPDCRAASEWSRRHAEFQRNVNHLVHCCCAQRVHHHGIDVSGRIEAQGRGHEKSD